MGGIGALSLAALAAAPLGAQGSGNGFLLGTPVGSLSLRAGYDRATASSDVFRDATTFLTLNKGDFSSMTLAADLGVRISSRLDFMLGTAVSGTSARSEDRKYIDNNDLPIEQTTKFMRVPVTAGLKAYLTPRGRSVGKFAWIPARIAPYAGAGVGLMWYRFEQTGDFTDYKTLDVFSNTYTSSRWAREAHAMLGTDYSITPRLALTGEVRYTWGSSPLSEDFSGYRPIDLSGAAATAGLTVRF
ncbi:MAG: outer membrane beta-barrel protein [Gemmatirosa sp.]|nr:outer membrane beta-barrel protein [Gemmatirosa sp.]